MSICLLSPIITQLTLQPAAEVTIISVLLNTNIHFTTRLETCEIILNLKTEE